MASIKGLLEEFRALAEDIKAKEDVIKSLKKELEPLKLRSKVVQAEITSFLESKQQTGVKTPDAEFEIKKVNRTPPLKKDVKINNGIQVLSRNNVRDPERVMGEIMNSFKGERTVQSTLKMSAINMF